jgi:predicted TPR repeat methyltransferase
MREPGSDECCGPTADPRVVRRFDVEYADWTDEEGFPELVDVSARMLDLLRDAPLAQPTVLEIGCGTGAVSVAMLEMGAASVHGVDLSAASIEVARQRADALGMASRATFDVGNGATLHGSRVDWVVADRVLCCDGRADRLVDAAIHAARHRIALTVPESRGWRGLLNCPMWALEAVWDVWRGGCRGYVHDLRRIERRLADAGFRTAHTSRIGLWFIGVYERA